MYLNINIYIYIYYMYKYIYIYYMYIYIYILYVYKYIYIYINIYIYIYICIYVYIPLTSKNLVSPGGSTAVCSIDGGNPAGPQAMPSRFRRLEDLRVDPEGILRQVLAQVEWVSLGYDNDKDENIQNLFMNI